MRIYLDWGSTEGDNELPYTLEVGALPPTGTVIQLREVRPAKDFFERTEWIDFKVEVEAINLDGNIPDDADYTVLVIPA